jgi:hypothetical protein
MTDDETRYIDQRLTTLDTKFEERWKHHEKRFDEIYTEIRSSLKDLGLKLQIMQERFLAQHENCMGEVDRKLHETELKTEKGIDQAEKKMWKLLTVILVAIPTLFYAIYQLATVLVSSVKTQ